MTRFRLSPDEFDTLIIAAALAVLACWFLSIAWQAQSLARVVVGVVTFTGLGLLLWNAAKYGTGSGEE